jgi:predicted small integral membrane protein
MVLRLCKVALVGSVGFFLLLVVFNNVTDYRSNFAFVSHVLAMDTTFEGNRGMWRAIHRPAIHHAFYWLIISWEVLATGLCIAGASRLWSARATAAGVFNRAKSLAILGLTVSLLQWFVAFITIGGEWFLMWQSRVWNGQEAAFRMFACIGIVLIILIQRDED